MTSSSPPRLDDEPPAGDQGAPTGLRRRRAPKVQLEGNEASDATQPAPDSDGGEHSAHHRLPTPSHKSYVDTLVGGAMRPSSDRTKGHGAHQAAVNTVDAHLRGCAAGMLLLWAALVVGVYIIVPDENIVRLDGAERNAAATAMSLIAVSVLSRIVPRLWGMGGKAGGDTGLKMSQQLRLNFSGIFVGGLTVQVVAFLTDFLMAFFPTPLMIDPVLGTRVHVLRWCEWFPCATYMTFMMEAADMYWAGEDPPKDFLKGKYMHAAKQGGAVFLGLMFPFCPGFKSWMACIVTAVALYLTNYPRMWARTKDIPRKLREGASVEEMERFNSARIALRLRYVTTLVWSIIVGGFFASSVFGPKFAPEGSLLRSPAANMMCESFVDVVSKVLFLVLIVEVHSAIFDPFARTERRLEELRKLMAAVWESSSDVIAISVKMGSDGGVSTVLSPAFFSLGSGDGPLRKLSKEQIKELFGRRSVLYQLSAEAFRTKEGNISQENEEGCDPMVKPEMIFNIEETAFAATDSPCSDLHFDGDVVKPETGALRAISDVVVRAWAREESEFELSHCLQWSAGPGSDQRRIVRSEAKVSRLDDGALIVTIRDISERVRAFEAEKRMLFETTSRQKDAEANRFTRHEVKNGLLAAIGLYESLCDAQTSQLTKSARDLVNRRKSEADIDLDIDEGDDVVRCMNELGKSLHETLDTILIEAMTRDLIHDLYRPHKEKVDVASMLSGSANEHSSFDASGLGNHSRFPLITRPSPLPQFYLDPHLLRYMHRQALNNACKYGRTGAPVLTEILYDEVGQEIRINVINLPGEYHDRLVKMGGEAERLVFKKGYQVHETFTGDAASQVSKKSEAAALPGDGAWIIKRCATIMKGDCSIRFEESRTVFSLSIPARPYGLQKRDKKHTPVDVKTFTLPATVWGIAIDDSKVQMKLLGKFFEFAGIPKDRIKVFGQTADEITGFVDFVVNFMDEHMGDHVLLIADENLDVMDEASKHVTISGSQLVETIRQSLLPEQEMKLVALVRSANDSASDVAIYKSRSHGFLPKAPIKRGNVLETLAPLWLARYPEQNVEEDDLSLETPSIASYTASVNNDVIGSTPFEISATVKEIDALFTQGSPAESWDIIWERLHVLKGDLLTLQVGSKVISAVGMINSFRELKTNEQLTERWNLLREHIAHWLLPGE
ncbi:hypothetical protein ACHAXT_001047 [Thalassiosira profunda]